MVYLSLLKCEAKDNAYTETLAVMKAIDIVAAAKLIIEKNNIDMKALWRYHANLE